MNNLILCDFCDAFIFPFVIIAFALWLLCVSLPTEIEKKSKKDVEDKLNNPLYWDSKRIRKHVNRVKRIHPEWFD